MVPTSMTNTKADCEKNYKKVSKNKRKYQALKPAALLAVHFVCGAILPIVQAFVGAVYIDDCPEEKFIPIYLIVSGALGMLKTTVDVFRSIIYKKEEWCQVVCDGYSPRGEYLPFFPKVVRSSYLFLNLFWIAWLIAGSVWVFRIYKPNNCSSTVYITAFTFIILNCTILMSCLIATMSCLAWCCCCCFWFGMDDTDEMSSFATIAWYLQVFMPTLYGLEVLPPCVRCVSCGDVCIITYMVCLTCCGCYKE